MTKAYHLAAFWGNRKESSRACAERLASFLTCLSEVDSAFSKWYELADTEGEATERPVNPTSTILTALLESGRSRRDTDQTVIESLGFQAGMWNGAEDTEAMSLMVHCGSFASSQLVEIPNSVVLDLPKQGGAARQILSNETLSRVMGCIVAAWDPDWASVRPSATLDAPPRPRSPSVPQAGWITYLSRRFVSVASDLDASHTVDFSNGGTMLIWDDLNPAKQ